MDKKKDILQAMESRRSVRTFEERDLTAEDREYLESLAADVSGPGPLGNRTRLVWLPLEDSRLPDGGRLGTYGVIRGSRGYLVGICENTPEAVTDLGYRLEEAIIGLTARNMGTCWLGGTFDRDSLAGVVPLLPGEIIPAIIPVGYSAGRPALKESAMRMLVGADKRKAFLDLFFFKDFSSPLQEEAAGKMAHALEMVRRGPSASNKQPWRLVLMEDRVHFYLAMTPNYAGNRLGFEMQRLDMGIALYHFEMTRRAQGSSGSWVPENPGIALPDNNTSYTLSWREEA